MDKGKLVYIVMILMLASPIASGFMGKSLTAQAGAPSNLSPEVLEDALALASPETQQCIECHVDVTPGIVYDWLGSEHAWSTPAQVAEIYTAIGANFTLADKFQDYPYTVGCYECHGMFKEADRPDVATNHFGFEIVTIVTLKDCSQCHLKEAQEITWTMHGFAALNAPLKPWYSKIVKYAKENGLVNEMLPPVYENTGKAIVDWSWYKDYASKLLNNPNDPIVQQFGTIYDYDFKTIVSPLYPASGVLNSTNLMHNSSYKNAYVYHACLQCHGSLVVPYQNNGMTVSYWGWPNNGAGRVDPDGSIGTCTACHTRHSFSIEEVRHPYTCGQCHLGYDHPHIEIYEESKHGNIYDAEGESWNWSALPWRVGVDFRAPTCATCHMSTIASPEGEILVQGSHDLRTRLVWDQMHFFSYPKPKWPDHTQNAIIKGGSQLTGAGLIENGVVPTGYEVRVDQAPQPGEIAFPRIVEVKYTGELKEKRDNMKAVCQLCHSSQWVDNYFATYDQVIVDYNITAHYAFDLLQKAYELGIHDPKNKLDEYMEIMWYYIWHHDGRRWRNGASMMGPDFAHWYGIVDTVMDKLGRMVSYYNTAVEIMQIRDQIAQLQAQGGSPEEIQQLQQQLTQLEARLSALEAEIPQLTQQIDMTKASLELVQENVTSLSQQISDISEKADTASQKAEEAAQAAGSAKTALAVGALGLIAALIALGLVIVRKP